MAKIRPARKKKKDRSSWQAVPCLLVLVSGMLLLTMLFFAILKSAT